MDTGSRAWRTLLESRFICNGGSAGPLFELKIHGERHFDRKELMQTFTVGTRKAHQLYCTGLLPAVFGGEKLLIVGKQREGQIFDYASPQCTVRRTYTGRLGSRKFTESRISNEY